MFFSAKSHVINVDDTHIDYVAFGTGNIPLIIIPGLTLTGVKGNHIPLSYQYRIFAKEYKVYVFDKRNSVPGGFTVKDLSEDIYYSMQSLGIESAHIFGVSLGGMIASEMAINHPDAVKSLTLAVTASRVNDSITKSVQTWVSYAQNNDLDGIVKDMMPKMYSEKYMKKYRLLLPLLARFAKLDFSRFINLAKACLTTDSYENLDKISCPVLVLGGMKDKITTPQGCTEIAEKLGCEIHMYNDYGHDAYEEAKDFNGRIYDFLKNIK